jgi:hypothetical protein
MQRSSTSKKWEHHIGQAESFAGGAYAYCKSVGISTSSFYLWRSRLKRQKSAKGLLKSPAKPPSFASVNVTCTKRELPDPEWLARFVSKFMGSAL